MTIDDLQATRRFCCILFSLKAILRREHRQYT
jgi:hypothetical protein